LLSASEGGAQETGFDAVGAEDGELAERDPLDGEVLLRALRLVMGDGVVNEVLELFGFLDTGRGEGRGGEAVFAGVEGGASLALGGAGSGRPRGVGPVGSELFFRDKFHRDSDVASRHALPCRSKLQITENTPNIILENL
jgi:hypothetical protein